MEKEGDIKNDVTSNISLLGSGCHARLYFDNSIELFQSLELWKSWKT